MPEFIFALANDEYAAAKTLFMEYAEWLNIDLGFQQFEEELFSLQTMYAAPGGCIILVKEAGRFVACVAVRDKGNKTAELKRMFVQPGMRKAGIAASMLHLAVAFCTNAGYELLKLDTLASMKPAVAFYKKHGFTETAAYYYNPNADTIYFERRL